jgi:hypothetical protein
MSEEYDRYKVPYETNLGDYMDSLRERFYEGIEFQQSRTIKLLETHVWQLDIAPDGKWEQRCRCGFYGVFNEHIIELIKGETK